MSRRLASALIGSIVVVLSGIAGAQTAGDARAVGGPEADDRVLQEIVVTATKRPEFVRDISGSVSAFDERQLEVLGAESFSDYLTRTPGVVFNQSIPGNSAATIRGVSTTTGIAQAQGTTGYFINDVPLTDPFYSAGIPDIDTFDVNNVTIMRGPQGTLFGSASMGGAIDYQAAKPDLTQFDIHARGSGASTHDGSASYRGNIMLNAPVVTDVFGVRGVFDYRRDGGYINNLGTGQNHSNTTDITGGRLLATVAPFAGTVINYMFLEQAEDTADVGFVDPGTGAYAKRTAFPEPFNYRTRLHNLRLDQQFSVGTLTVTASRHEKTFSTLQDFSNLLPSALAPVQFPEYGTINGNTFEVRLASRPKSRFEYLIGAFYDATNEYIVDQLIAPNAAPIFGNALLLDAPVRAYGKEGALFGEMSWHFTEQWKATLGGRYFKTKLTTIVSQSGPLVGSASTSEGDSKENGFSPKVSVTWSPGPDVLVYGLMSKGFRFGGPNITAGLDPTIPASFKSDSLKNYELGVRSNLFDRRLQLDGTLFWVDWTNIQTTLSTPGGFTYTDNAGKARNYGLEGTATFRASRNLTLQANMTYLDATLRENFVSGTTIVPTGATLPGASKWQVSDSAVYAFSGSALKPTIVLSRRYISGAPGALVTAPPEQGNYNLFDVRASATLAGVGITAFVENIADKRGVTQAFASNRGFSEYLVRPRTYGVTLDYKL
jgi:outer membrane receptor protein involved in Fe transport